VNDISHVRFAEFFHALHHREPYSWQSRLAARAISGNWTGIIDVPTGCGKTACIDIAIFACACEAQRAPKDRTAPRRIFFCVNRRVIVDEAYERAKLVARKLDEAGRNQEAAPAILRDVAEALRAVAGTEPGDDAPPLDAIELRGGIYRDNRWARSAQQPTVICTTIDQLGSRLLFRGYGVSSSAAPIQAALIAYDSLVLLDEAHISTPFRRTLEAVRRYLGPEPRAGGSIGVPPMVFLPMSATPAAGGTAADVVRLDDDDRNNEALARRLAAPKPATLHRVSDVPRAIVDHATRLALLGGPPVAIGIIVNRVASAKDIYTRLHSSLTDAAVELVIGSMRPIDRDEQSKRIAYDVGPGRGDVARRLSVVVATQCLECGADYDFDVLITECASLDALRQRFGRLNRRGRPIAARAAVFVKDKDAKPVEALSDDEPLDPIYGNALARTWHWLWDHATTQTTPGAAELAPKRAKGKPKPAAESRTVDFGIDALRTLLGENGRIPDELLAPSASLPAPVMLPSHLDFWCQTSSPPVPDPDVALFIHGKQRGEPDVQVCWRGDLVEAEHLTRGDWVDVVSMLPPTAPECMSVPISRVRRWLAQASDKTPDLGDLLDVAANGESEPNGDRADVGPDLGIVLWRGVSKSKLLASPGELRPGDTLVVPVTCEGWNELGHIPEPAPEQGGKGEPPPDQPATVGGPPIDVAEQAFLAVRDRQVLRLHPSLFQSRRDDDAVKELLKVIAESDGLPAVGELRHLLRSASEALPETEESLRKKLADFAKNTFARVAYPDGRGVVITARDPSGSQTWRSVMPLDDGDDDASRIGGSGPVSLADHTRHVQEAVALTLQAVPTAVSNEVFDAVAERHDWGKADERFQAWLGDTGRTDYWLFAGAAPTLLAKSGRPQTITERKAARQRAGLPDGFRHEMLSVQLAESAAIAATLAPERDLILHLIAAHHGYARPFAPAAVDDDPPDVAVYGVGLSAHSRREMPPQRLDSGIADRFWSLTRRFGWWGLAYLEALLRLADQRASAREDAGRRDDHDTSGNSESRS
jgi:CRISPR-associated endonuclease/helicase Cas3